MLRLGLSRAVSIGRNIRLPTTNCTDWIGNTSGSGESNRLGVDGDDDEDDAVTAGDSIGLCLSDADAGLTGRAGQNVGPI